MAIASLLFHISLALYTYVLTIKINVASGVLGAFSGELDSCCRQDRFKRESEGL